MLNKEMLLTSAKGYTKATMHVGYASKTNIGTKWGYDHDWNIGSISDTSLLGPNGSLYAMYSWGAQVICGVSSGTKHTSVIINEIYELPFSPYEGSYSFAFDTGESTVILNAFNFLTAHKNQDITIYLK